MSANEKIIVAVKVVLNYLASAFIIAMTRVSGDSKYQLYRHWTGLKRTVQVLLNASVVVVSNDIGFEEIPQVQDHLPDYQIIVFDGTNPDRVILSGNSRSAKNYIYYTIGTIYTTM